MNTTPNPENSATFAAGCFWGVEQTFRKVPGVSDVIVGYTGGHTVNPCYEEVCSHTTGHAEAVKITFDPKLIDYRTLLDVFWNCHTPTQWNRQDPDVGSQYRSAIFYHSLQQKQLAEQSKLALSQSKKYNDPIVTLIEPAGIFYKAEEYHQRYFEKHGGGCHI